MKTLISGIKGQKFKFDGHNGNGGDKVIMIRGGDGQGGGHTQRCLTTLLMDRGPHRVVIPCQKSKVTGGRGNPNP